MSEKTEKNQASPKTAAPGHVLAVICKSGCGEIKPRRHRSDAQQWQREHLKDHPKHKLKADWRFARNA